MAWTVARRVAKAHVVIRAQDQVPCFIDLTEGRRNDKIAMASVPLAKGSVLVFDMGYTSFEQWRVWSAQGVHWVPYLCKVALTPCSAASCTIRSFSSLLYFLRSFMVTRFMV